MAQQTGAKILPQSKEAQLKSYQKRLKDDIKSMFDNFGEIFKLIRIDDEPVLGRASQAEQDRLEIEVRSANMVKSSESLMKLVSEIKQFLILNDFAQVNESIRASVDYNNKLQTKIDSHIISIRDEMICELFDLEEEYYTSKRAIANRWKWIFKYSL